MIGTPVYCPGSNKVGVQSEGWRARCPRCGRWIKTRPYSGTLYNHVPSLSRSSKRYAERRRAEEVSRAQAWRYGVRDDGWTPPATLVLRW